MPTLNVDLPRVFNRLALTMVQVSLLLFAWWGIAIVMAEIGSADRAYWFLCWVMLAIGLAITSAGLSLGVRLWTNPSPPGLVPLVALAAVPVLIASAIVILRPDHTYNQRPFQSLQSFIQVVGR